ncbi:MAG: hypothetical protein IPP40_15900 [bacterium]|nr:hypothetical protein [bacterium]
MWNTALAEGKGAKNEPVNATIVTSVIVLAFVSLGSVDFVAQIISMFFMITYGTLCLISFLSTSPEIHRTARLLERAGIFHCWAQSHRLS